MPATALQGMNLLQSLVRQSEERGALSLLYCATEPGLSGTGKTSYICNVLQHKEYTTIMVLGCELQVKAGSTMGPAS